MELAQVGDVREHLGVTFVDYCCLCSCDNSEDEVVVVVVFAVGGGAAGCSRQR